MSKKADYRGLRIYVAGPMRGVTNRNRGQFAKATQLWRSCGAVVYCPSELGLSIGYDVGLENDNDPHHLRHAMQVDVQCLFAAQAIALLPQWQRSEGATVEVALSQFLKLQAYDAFTMEAIDIKTLPYALSHPTDEDWSEVWRNLARRDAS